ncbi:hypothetical protein BDZ91DRAFT_799858 [Kalaharituber pfeilii]|nr:hypothetical protein BDZ91DRAFT_799858 [Kalaharituber pfeilii]
MVACVNQDNNALPSTVALVPPPPLKVITLVMKVQLLDYRVRTLRLPLTYPPPQVDESAPAFQSILHQSGLSSHVLRNNPYWDITVVKTGAAAVEGWLREETLIPENTYLDQLHAPSWAERMPSNNGMEWVRWVWGLWGSYFLLDKHERGVDEGGWLVGVVVV